MNTSSLKQKRPCKGKYLVLAYYKIIPIEDKEALVKEHQEYLKDKDIKCRVYISSNGINGQMSASYEDAYRYIDWMHSHKLFKDLQFKVHYWDEHVFPRQSVKLRKQLVALDEKVDFSNAGELVKPSEWKKMMDAGDTYHLIDVRNDYEWEVGRFKGAENPKCNTFREFIQYSDELSKRFKEEKPAVMMYCTGGIRCEFFSAVLKEKGFEKVYQLDGGVINYGLKEGSKHWLGKLFVFDDRMTVPINDEDEAEKIGSCTLCNTKDDNYYNCANMDCNKLYICCQKCLEDYNGCCSKECMEAARVRPLNQQNPHKPFRKYYHYFGLKKNEAK